MKTFIYQRGRRAEPCCGCGREETVRGVELEHLLLPLEGLEGGELRQPGEQAARHGVLVQQVARRLQPAAGHRVADQVARVLQGVLSNEFGYSIMHYVLLGLDVMVT